MARIAVKHYHWAGLDFLIDGDGAPVFIEANRASHMLGEYMQFFGDERPFELAARVMCQGLGPPCLLWRRDDPLPDADEDACFIGRHLSKYLSEPAVIGNVEDNQQPSEEFIARDGRRVRPGSIFRWWYALPWVYERSGAIVINPNCLWVTVRDKLLCSQSLAGTSRFRVPASFAVESSADVRRIVAGAPEVFRKGFVLKPRVGWGGHGVQVADPADEPRQINGKYMLSERIVPAPIEGRFWEARVFVMAGVYLGGLCHTSDLPLTNYWQGATAGPLAPAIAAELEPAALEAVQLLDAAADRIHSRPEPPESSLTNVRYEGIGMEI
jgi:hypothetical protein